MPLSTLQLNALSSAVAALGQAQSNVVSVVGSIPVEQPPAPPPPPPAPPPPAPPPPPPPPPGPGATLYFSASGSNSNPGTEASPKLNLAGLDINSLPAGSALRFKRDESFTLSNTRLRNLNNTAAAPLTFEAYGEGFRPLLQFANGTGFEFGMNFSDTTEHGHYVFRGLDVRGDDATTGFAFWCKKNIHDVLIEYCTIQNWHVGVNGQGGDNSRRITVQHCSIFNNRAMGWLGEFHDSTFHGNDFTGPGLPATHFVHLAYHRGGSNITVTNNRVLSAGPAMGGTLTAHGLIDGLHIVGNNFEYGPGSDPGAWVISLIPDNGAAQGGFLNLVVRGNTITNAGNNGIHIEASPGAVVEYNTLILTEARYQQAIAYGDDPGRPQDLKGPGISRFNVARGPAGAQFGFSAPPGSDEHDNTVEVV